MLGQDVVDRVRLALHEPAGGERWTTDELALWITDACRLIALHRPDSCAQSVTFTLAAGSRQSIAGLTPAGLRVLDVLGIKLVDRQVLDAYRPGWMSEANGTPVNWVFDNREPKVFWTYPPATAALTVPLLYATAPAVVTPASMGSQVLSLDDIYMPVVVDLTLFRAYAKDGDTQNVNAAAGYLAAASAALGIKLRSDFAQSPDANSAGGTVAAGATVGGV